MKTAKYLLIMAVPLVMMSCNNQRANRQDNKNLADKAVVVENAKVDANKDNEPQSVENFVQEAAYGGMMEVELGRYAQQNASSPRVKNFGAMMVRDHSKANDELKSIAAGKSMTVPATLDDKHQNNMNDVMKKKGADFDKDYMKMMVDDHNKDVDEFRKQSENGKDPEIKAFAAKTLQVLVVHQDSAKRINDALNK
ncbi:MAG TPA: DUF4142 domain-containing protein [Bacteroidales bacterium]|jgi:putative membrane protein|nr:DUF4142 domain-containing protein [Bacteroidales bacterium]